MLSISSKTINHVFEDAVTRWPDKPFLCSPTKNGTDLFELSYQQVSNFVEACSNELRLANYGYAQRAALLIGSNPNHYIFKLSLNRIGMSCVPINPDFTVSEIVYLLEDSSAMLVVTTPLYEKIVKEAASIAKNSPAVFIFKGQFSNFPRSNQNPSKQSIKLSTEASLLYTSGTTGKPKGCILSHEYELLCGAVYPNIKGPIKLRENRDRIFNPLPSFHINAGIVSFFGAMLSGNCLIQPDRFHASTWWDDIYQTKATIFHYLGVIIAVLLSDKSVAKRKLKFLRAGLGAGVEPVLHVDFEKCFKIPLVEVWGMTEMCQIFVADEEPRMTNTRAMGKPRHGLKVRVVDESDKDVPPNTPGQMLLRHSGDNPRQGFFSGYLNKPTETEKAWKGGWFHTGDTVTMDQNKMLYFVDRSKNIIRRSGENIAAAEIEDKLYKNELVLKVACLAVLDEVREEEVLSCIVLKPGVSKTKHCAEEIFDSISDELAYFKLPGWILFLDDLPVTSTQKVVKHKIFSDGFDPRYLPYSFDLRSRKKRKSYL